MKFNLLRKWWPKLGQRSTTFSADPGPGFLRWGDILSDLGGSGVRNTKLTHPTAQHPIAAGAIRLAGTMLGSVPFRIVEEDKAANQRLQGALERGCEAELRSVQEFERMAKKHRPASCTRMHQGAPTKPAPAGNPWQWLFENGTAGLSRSELFSATVQQMLGSASGTCYWLLRGGAEGKIDETTIPREVSVWPASAVKLEGDGSYTFKTERGKVKYPAHQVICFRNYAAHKSGADSPLRAAMANMQADLAAQEWNAEFFDNGAQVGNVLSSDQKLTQEQADAYAARWDEKHRKNGGTAVLGQGVTLTATTATHREMDFVEGFKVNRDAVLACLVVHKAALGATDDLNRATIEAARKMMWSNLLIPLGAYIEDVAYSQLFSRFDQGRMWGVFDISGVPELADNVQTQADALATLTNAGIPMNDAVRVTGLDLPLYSWGEDPLGHLGGVADNPTGGKNPTAVEQDEANEVIESQAVKLNGAQIQSAQSVIADLIAGLVPESVALSLLIAVGISDDVASKMVKDAKAFKPKAQPERLAAAQDRHSRAQGKADAWWHSVGNPIERKFQSKVRRVFMDIREEVLKNLDAQRSSTREIDEAEITALLFDINRYTEALKEGTETLYQRTMESAFDGIVAELEAAGYTDTGLKFNMTDAAINRWLETKDLRLRHVIENVRNEIQRAITAKVKENASVQEIAKEIRRVSNYQLKPSRTLMIARTETGSASNNVRWLGMEAAGVQHVSWVAASDAREEHRAINDLTLEAAAKGEPYERGTDFAPLVGAPGVLRFPHDPQGEAGMVINCRCTMVPEIHESQEI